MPLELKLEDHHCARCHERVVPPVVYQDGLWLHLHCLQDGARQRADAMRLAESCRASERPMSEQRLMGG
jgi:hypothetical protein